MKVSYNWLNTYFKRGFLSRGLPRPEKVAEMLTAHAFEVEDIQRTNGDTTFEVKVLPDRAHYALSHRGIAGEISAISRIPLASKQKEIVFAVESGVAKPRVKIADATLCRRYIARRIDNVIVGDAPKAIRAKLEAIGQRSINSVVDATNFVMYDMGQPLHAFDADKVQGAIVARLAKPGEKIVVLDGREIELLPSDLVIADDVGALAIAGVKGGKRAEVTKDTKNLIIESANFHPTSVRRTSTRTNLRSDSSKRFENEITPVMAEDAMRQVTELIFASSKGAKPGEAVDVYPDTVKPWTVEVDPSYMNAVTGLSLSKADMKDILSRLDCKVEEKGASLLVMPPLSRLDLRIPEDIADELVRMVGYDKLPGVELPEITPVPVDKTFYHSEKIKDVLINMGFSELQTYTLAPKGVFEISYPLASDKSALRTSLVPKMAESLALNICNADLLGLEAVKTFEIGRVFTKEGEKTMLSIGAALARKKKGVTAESLVKEALGALGVDAAVKDGIAEIDLDAHMATLPSTDSVAGLPFKSNLGDIRYKPFSLYPYIVRDIALFVPASVSEDEVRSELVKSLSAAAKELLVKGPERFDRFEKDGRVSYAFRSIFQSFTRTLSDEEANGYMKAAYDAAKAKGWEVR